MLQFTSESPNPFFDDSGMHNRSLNLEDKMQRTFFLATATNLPFTLHSTIIKQKLTISKGNNYRREGKYTT